MKKGLIKKLFSEEENWGEWEAKFIKDLGWLIFSVEDTAGSITLWLTSQKLEKPPMTEGENILLNLCGILKGKYKLQYYGSFGNTNGKGCLYWNPVHGTYTEKQEFKNYAEGNRILEKKLFSI